MRFLVRRDEELQHGSDGGGDVGSGMLEQAREQGDRLLAVGDEAIRRALSGSDSESFLRSAQQQGGE